jgi:hypothetical protein
MAGLEELMRKSREESETVPIPISPEVRERAAKIEVAGQQAAKAEAKSITEIEAAMNGGSRVELKPNGEIVIGGTVGERSDGTFGMVLTIAEGYIDPIRQQADSDGVTPEEWVSQRFNEYLETWWSPPKGR